MRAVGTLMWFGVLAQWRSRSLLLAALAAFMMGGVALWAGAMALTERQEVMLSLAAPLARLSCVVLTMLTSISVVVRDIQDRSWLLMLAAPLSRPLWLLGTGLGLALGGLANALICSAPLWLLHPSEATLMWSLSLGLEAVLVSALALAAALALRQVPAAVLATAVFYVGARVMGLVQLLNQRAPFEQDFLQLVSTGLIDSLVLLLPRLDHFTLTTWLLPHGNGIATVSPGWALAKIALETFIYCVIAGAAASIDLARKEVA